MSLLTAGSTFHSVTELITVLFIFAFVLVITYYVTRWIAGYQKEHMKQGNLAVTEAIRLPGNKYIELIRVSEEKYVVVGVGKNELTLLATLTKDEVRELTASQTKDAVGLGGFAESFAQAKKSLQDKFPKK